MERVWERRDREVVLVALRQAERPDTAMTRACGSMGGVVAFGGGGHRQ